MMADSPMDNAAVVRDGAPEADAVYTVQLRVEMDGPDVDWEGVAHMLAQRVEGLRLRGGFRVLAAHIDEAPDA